MKTSKIIKWELMVIEPIGSLYDLISSENLSELQRNLIEKKSHKSKLRSKGPNEWNKARIIVEGGNVEHWLNNILVVRYDRFSKHSKILLKKVNFMIKRLWSCK